MVRSFRRALFLTVAVLIASTVPVFSGGNRERRAAEEPAATTTRIENDRVAARVNGRPVSLDELDKVVESNKQRYAAQGMQLSPEQESMLKQQVLDGLVMREVLEQEAGRLSVSVTDDEFRAVIAEFQSQFPDEATFELILQQQGYTRAQFEVELRRQMVIEKLIEREAFGAIVVSAEDTRAFYNENTEIFEQPEQIAARHILFSTQDMTSDAERADARRRADEVRARIVAGGDFAQMAREYGEDPTAEQGGDLGLFGRGMMVPPFEEAAFALQVGEVSQVVETQFGYHLIQVTEKVAAQTHAYEAVADRIEAYLLEELRNEAAQSYVMGLREAANVETLIQF